MYLILVVGHTGQGKTTWVRDYIKGKKKYVFDVNNEFQDLPTDSQYKEEMRHTELNIKKFVEVCKTLKNTCCVFEDATGFFRGRQSEDVSRMLVAKRHTGNNYIILFG